MVVAETREFAALKGGRGVRMRRPKNVGPRATVRRRNQDLDRAPAACYEEYARADAPDKVNHFGEEVLGPT